MIWCMVEKMINNNKHFKLIGERFISDEVGYVQIISNGYLVYHLWEDKEDAQSICDDLNILIDRNKQLLVDLKTLQLQDEDRKKYQRELKQKNLRLIDSNHQLKLILNDDSIYQKMIHYRKRFMEVCDELVEEGQINRKLEKENKQLKSELSRYKEVNRLDIWKSSYSSEDALITELQNKCDKKQEHIVLLENKIHRMREAIHKLEWLATHRNGELKRENEYLKQEVETLQEELAHFLGDVE